MNNSATKTRFAVVVSILLLVFAAVLGGCTDDEEPGDGFGNDVDQQDTDTDDEDPDAGEDADDVDEDTDGDDVVDGPCRGVECEDDEFCEDGVCIESGHGYACQDAIELDLDEAGTETVSADPREAPIDVPTNCSAADGPQTVFEISVDTTTRLTTSIPEFDFATPPVKELRASHCDDPVAADSDYGDDGCSINSQNFIVEPDDEYYLIVRPDPDELIGEFDLEVEVEPLVCEPGERSCEDGDVHRCAGGDELVEHPCVDGCTDGQCVGDGCANPIVLEGDISFTAEMDSFHNNLDFSNSPACSTLGAEGPDTDGQDIVFSLPDLTEGQTVHASSPGGHYRIGIMEDCSEASTQCVDGNSTDEEFEWTVDTAGDYYLAFNRSTTSSESAEFSIDID